MLYFIDYRLANISIHTSNVPSPEDPSTSSSDWIFRHYRQDPYGAVGTIDFNPPIEAQHVAVISTLVGEPLSLAEVLVYGKFDDCNLKTDYRIENPLAMI